MNWIKVATAMATSLTSQIQIYNSASHQAQVVKTLEAMLQAQILCTKKWVLLEQPSVVAAILNLETVLSPTTST